MADRKADPKPVLDVKGFQGVVMVMDWVAMPDGHVYKGFQGKVTVLSAEEAVGWVPTGHNTANWLARIEGPTSSVNLMGCQVRLVVEGALASGVPDRDVLVVP